MADDNLNVVRNWFFTLKSKYILIRERVFFSFLLTKLNFSSLASIIYIWVSVLALSCVFCFERQLFHIWCLIKKNSPANIAIIQSNKILFLPPSDVPRSPSFSLSLCPPLHTHISSRTHIYSIQRSWTKLAVRLYHKSVRHPFCVPLLKRLPLF